MSSGMENNDRFPIIPLNYENRHLAHKKELLVGDEGRLYVVDKDDKSIIWDVTAQILKLVGNQVPGESIYVNIQGIGVVNLKTYLEQMKSKGLDIKETSSMAGLPTYQCDIKSIVIRDGKLEIYGFNSAEDDTVLTKHNGVVRFRSLDGILRINEVTPDVNNTIVLRQHHNKSTLTHDTVVELQAVNQVDKAYNIIEWTVETQNENVLLLFDSQVKYEFEGDNIIPNNSIYRYIFESYDQGNLWFERVHKYTKAAAPNKRVDTSFMLDNYYTKPEVNDLIKWKNKNQQNLEE